MKTIKGFKVTSHDDTCRGFKYEEGKEYNHQGYINLCSSGFHFCKELKDCYNYYSFDYKNQVFEVEGSGDIIEGDDKVVCRTIKIIRRLSIGEVLEGLNLFCNSNQGSGNQGSDNQGSSNRGSYNRGSWNQGSDNQGSGNQGSDNQGSWNRGSWNQGSRNQGSGNQGSWNQGSRNQGSGNQGSWNQGSRNQGSGNQGSWNQGSENQGIYNFGSHTVGVFNYTSFIGDKDNCCSFNVKTGLSLVQFYRKYMDILKEVKSYNFDNVYKLPGYTAKKWDIIKRYI